MWEMHIPHHQGRRTPPGAKLEREAAPGTQNRQRLSLREKGGIPFKCGGGLCGTCKCLIERGLENTDAIKPKERKHLTEEQFAAGYRMACQTFLNGDVSVSSTVKASVDTDPVGVCSPGD